MTEETAVEAYRDGGSTRQSLLCVINWAHSRNTERNRCLERGNDNRPSKRGHETNYEDTAVTWGNRNPEGRNPERGPIRRRNWRPSVSKIPTSGEGTTKRLLQPNNENQDRAAPDDPMTGRRQAWAHDELPHSARLPLRHCMLRLPHCRPLRLPHGRRLARPWTPLHRSGKFFGPPPPYPTNALAFSSLIPMIPQIDSEFGCQRQAPAAHGRWRRRRIAKRGAWSHVSPSTPSTR